MKRYRSGKLMWGKLYVKTLGNNWIELKGIIQMYNAEQGCH